MCLVEYVVHAWMVMCLILGGMNVWMLMSLGVYDVHAWLVMCFIMSSDMYRTVHYVQCHMYVLFWSSSFVLNFCVLAYYCIAFLFFLYFCVSVF